jgi:hypothetical protein
MRAFSFPCKLSFLISISGGVLDIKSDPNCCGRGMLKEVKNPAPCHIASQNKGKKKKIEKIKPHSDVIVP